MKIGLILAILLVMAVGLLVVEPLVIPHDKVVFLDVGQGDSILFQRGTQQVLLDGGAGNLVLSRLGEELPWFDKKIEVVVSTHPDKDHLEGLLQVVRKYDVGLVLLPLVPHTSQLQESWLNELEKLMQEGRGQVRVVQAGQRLLLDGVTFEVLSPWEELIASLGGKTNSGSVIMRADYKDLSVLLTADAEEIVERQLVQREVRGKLKTDVLKVGHHGSKTSTSETLLQAISPKLAVISVGAKNTYGHPTQQTLDRLAGILTLRTDERGSVRLTRVDNQWLLSCSRKECIKK
ncbi:MAG: MBL fold metallo-hydrolase [Candidatus Andersenbacteria bacterium]|nr:MBL fold metallo-hydrolase [Candidatus Andersenbacteria bacterium]